MPAQRLGDEGPWHSGMVQRGRVELHELHVGDGHAGAHSHGDPVASCLGRVRRDGEQLTGAATGKHHVLGLDPL